jgi:hypothetical protein
VRDKIKSLRYSGRFTGIERKRGERDRGREVRGVKVKGEKERKRDRG